MATTDAPADAHDRQPQHRRRPFSTWVKKLTNFKSSSDGARSKRQAGKTRRGSKLNNPYPQSGHVSATHGTDRDSVQAGNGASARSLATAAAGSLLSADDALRCSAEGHGPATAGATSMAGTASTENEGQRSMVAPSHGASSLMSRTVGGGMESRRGGDSTFSSPAPSVRSLTTTLTTIQSSMAPNGAHLSAPTHANNTQSIHFSQPFPSTSPASAIPAHLAPTGHPATYTAATANNLLTDNASILTLASSSNRRRRRSMDTDASVRALAPSSLWGGSRESLPLSVLSANVEGGGMPTTPGVHGGPGAGAGGGGGGGGPRLGAAAERNSIYSTTGVAPTLASERNSLYAKQGDGTSVGSGLLGHGRPDSGGGGPAAPVPSPLASPREVLARERPAAATVAAADDKDEPRAPPPPKEE